MLIISVNTGEVVQHLQAIHQRLNNRALFFRQVVRPRLLDEFEAAYRAAGVGIRSGRLIESYISLAHGEHISQISRDRITEGSRVPYAIFVERLLPVAGRIARNQGLIRDFSRQLGEFLVDGN